MGNRIYGCDDCLAVCPWNRFADAARANRAFLPRAELAAPSLADLLALDDAGFRKVFAGSPIKRIGRNRMVRNAAIAAGNSGLPELIPVLERLTRRRGRGGRRGGALGDDAQTQRRLSVSTQAARSVSRPSGRRASTWVTTASPPRAAADRDRHRARRPGRGTGACAPGPRARRARARRTGRSGRGRCGPSPPRARPACAAAPGRSAGARCGRAAPRAAAAAPACRRPAPPPAAG